MTGDKKQEPQTLGQRVKWARRRLGLSQRMLADELGLSQTAISSIEEDKTKTSHVVRIARALKCSADWLEYGIGHITETSTPIYRVPIIPWGQVAKWKQHIKNPQEILLMNNYDAPYWFSIPLPNNLMKSDNPAESFEQDEMVLFDPRLEPKSGNCVFAIKKKSGNDENGEPIFKKLVIDGQRKYLITNQGGIPPIEVDETVEIQAVAVGKQRMTMIINYDEYKHLDKK